MKEDILEQLVEDWFVSQTGWFVKHNVKYKPKKTHADFNMNQDSVNSDIDILAFSNIQKGKERVAVVNCKSWQGGFHAAHWLSDLEKPAIYNTRSTKFKKREPWKAFRELVSEKWTEAFLSTLQNETGQRDLTYYVAITKLNGEPADRQRFETSRTIRDRFKKYRSKIDLRLLPLADILNEHTRRLTLKDTPFLEATNVGRLLQLMKAAGIEFKP